MFSLSLPLSLHQMLSAPFVARSRGEVAAAGGGAAESPVAASTVLVSAYEDPLPDLDQRVRAIGEW